MKTTSRVFKEVKVRTGYRYKKGKMYQRTGTIVLCTKSEDYLVGVVIADASECYSVGTFHDDWRWFRRFHGMVQMEN